MSGNISTGRGGAGNIGKDTGVYTDGGIVREGPAGQSASAGEYSSGRGGAGNISHSGGNTPVAPGTPRTHPHPRTDDDYVPETDLRAGGGEYANYHTGRGGGGNVHKDKYGGHSSKHEQDTAGEGVGDKVKRVLHLDGGGKSREEKEEKREEKREARKHGMQGAALDEERTEKSEAREEAEVMESEKEKRLEKGEKKQEKQEARKHGMQGGTLDEEKTERSAKEERD